MRVSLLANHAVSLQLALFLLMAEGALIPAATVAASSLTSFRDKVSTLGAQGKLGGAEAEALNAEANDAITCVEGLRAQDQSAA